MRRSHCGSENLALLNEQLHRFGEANNEHYEQLIHSIENSPQYERLEEFLEHVEKDFHRPETVVHTIGALQAVFGLVDGVLRIGLWRIGDDKDDEKELELQKRLRELHGDLPTVNSFVDLVKVSIELGIGSASVTALIVAGIARLSGDVALAESALGVAGSLGGALADAVAGIEILHGFLVLVDSDVSRQEKVDAAVGIASGSAWFIGRAIGGKTMGSPASIAVAAGYLLLKLELSLYWKGAYGINKLLTNPTFAYLSGYAVHFASLSDKVDRAELLLQKEHDPLRARPLAQALASYESSLAVGLDDFLAHARPKGAKDMGFLGSAVLSPGNVTILAEVFEPLQRYRGVKSGPRLAEAAGHVLQRIRWCAQNSEQIVVASAKQDKHLSDVVEGPRKRSDWAGASREAVLKEIGAVPQMRVEFIVGGYRLQDARVVATRIPNLDLLWFVTGTNEELTLGDLSAKGIVFEGRADSFDVKFTKDASGKLSYEDIPSDTQAYFRAVARGLGQGEPQMQQESFDGMRDIYTQLLMTPLNEANLRGER